MGQTEELQQRIICKSRKTDRDNSLRGTNEPMNARAWPCVKCSGLNVVGPKPYQPYHLHWPWDCRECKDVFQSSTSQSGASTWRKTKVNEQIYAKYCSWLSIELLNKQVCLIGNAFLVWTNWGRPVETFLSCPAGGKGAFSDSSVQYVYEHEWLHAASPYSW